MRNLHEVLQQKEMDLARVRHEVEALRSVAPLLIDPEDQPGNTNELSWPEATPKNRWPLEVEELRQISPGL